MLDSLRVPGAAGGLEGFGGKPLDLPPGQFLGHDGSLTLLELQESLKDEKKKERRRRSVLLFSINCHVSFFALIFSGGVCSGINFIRYKLELRRNLIQGQRPDRRDV